MMIDGNDFRDEMQIMLSDFHRISYEYDAFSKSFFRFLNKHLQTHALGEVIIPGLNNEIIDAGVALNNNMKNYLEIIEKLISESQIAVEHYNDDIAKFLQ
ncbi:MAG: hypothetical protein PUB37_10605 [Firmicutes bacterium]|nr:hypothetical protein [Bacillota bacterium]